MKNKVILTADCEFADVELREYMTKLDKKIQNINERTKSHTIEIRNLKKQIKELEKL